MIYFCEDCGSKNVFTTAPLKNGKAVFRCTSCQYFNSYQIKPNQGISLDKADRFFMETREAPDIIGVFLFHKKNGVLKNSMPNSLKENDLMVLGKVLVNSYQSCQSHYRDVNAITLVISDKNIIARQIHSELFIILACRTPWLPERIKDRLNWLISDRDQQQS